MIVTGVVTIGEIGIKNMKIENYPRIGKRYLHYKGGEYEVLTLAKHSETNENLVIYKSIHFGSVHARPLVMFFENISLSTDDESVITTQRFIEII